MTTNHTDGSRIRLAIAGVGNCASSLIQGLEYYREADPNDDVPGLMHVELGGYHIRDIDLVAAFDVDATKVGIDTAKAIFAGQNNTIRFAPVPETGVTVQRGPTLDGFGKYYRLTCEESPAEPIDVAQALRDAQADVLVSYLPVGSEQAQKYYAQACLDAGVAFVNAPLGVPGPSCRLSAPTPARARRRWSRAPRSCRCADCPTARSRSSW